MFGLSSGKDIERYYVSFTDYSSAYIWLLVNIPKIVELYPNLVTMGISRKTGHVDKPENVKVPKGLIWCPYCGNIRNVQEYFKVKYCKVCGIPVKDYHVQRNNRRS